MLACALLFAGGRAAAQQATAALLPPSLPGWIEVETRFRRGGPEEHGATRVFAQPGALVVLAILDRRGRPSFDPRGIARPGGTSPYHGAELAAVAGFDFVLYPHRLGWIAAGSVGPHYAVTVSFLGAATDDHAKRAMLRYLAATKLAILARQP